MSDLTLRPQIKALQATLESMPQSRDFEASVEHFFGDGTYSRLMRLKADDLIVGKTHRLDHVVVVLAGEIELACVSGTRTRVMGGQVFESKAGAKRAMYAVTDCAVLTIHPNPTNTRDMAELESALIAPEDAP